MGSLFFFVYKWTFVRLPRNLAPASGLVRFFDRSLVCHEIQTIVDLFIASAALICDSNNDAEVLITGSEYRDRNAYYRQRLSRPLFAISATV